MKVAQYEVLENDAKRHLRLARDDRNIRLESRMRLSDSQHSSIVPSGTDRSLKTLTQHFVLGYFRRVPTGLIFSNCRTTCAILIATCQINAYGQTPDQLAVFQAATCPQRFA
jgi:hypothetical protein